MYYSYSIEHDGAYHDGAWLVIIHTYNYMQRHSSAGKNPSSLISKINILSIKLHISFLLCDHSLFNIDVVKYKNSSFD